MPSRLLCVFGNDNRLAGDGKHLVAVPTEGKVLKRIIRERRRGMSYDLIADDLNADRIPTKGGGRWYPATVRSVLATARRREAVHVGSRDHAALAKPRRKRAA